MNTKTIFKVFICCIIFTHGFAQSSDCEYEKNEIDKFTKKKILVTKVERFTKLLGPSSFVYGVSEGERKFLGVELILSSNFDNQPSKSDLDNTITIGKGSKLIILLDDQNTVELLTDRSFRGSSTVTDPNTRTNGTNKYFVTTTIFINYPLDNNSIQILTSKGSSSMRIETSNGNKDYDFAKREHDAIQKVLKCIQ